MFLTGLGLWLAAVVTTFVTGNPNLVPTVVLLGSFLVPVTFVVWAWQRREAGELNASLLFSTFVAGGVLGVVAASVLEAYLLRPSWWLFLGVGAIEELVKLVALAFLTRRLQHKSLRDGMILGASVGFGFAAFESAGYAFTALFTTDGLSLSQLVGTELLRGVLAPVGHGLWTAILGGVLFRASSRHSFTLTGRLAAAFAGAAARLLGLDAQHRRPAHPAADPRRAVRAHQHRLDRAPHRRAGPDHAGRRVERHGADRAHRPGVARAGVALRPPRRSPRAAAGLAGRRPRVRPLTPRA